MRRSGSSAPSGSRIPSSTASLTGHALRFRRETASGASSARTSTSRSPSSGAGQSPMLVLEDEQGRATAVAEDLHARLERLGVYEREHRPWLPHVTVVRFRQRPRLAPELPELGAFSPSDAALYHSVLRSTGAQYEVLNAFALGG